MLGSWGDPLFSGHLAIREDAEVVSSRLCLLCSLELDTSLRARSLALRGNTPFRSRDWNYTRNLECSKRRIFVRLWLHDVQLKAAEVPVPVGYHLGPSPSTPQLTRMFDFSFEVEPPPSKPLPYLVVRLGVLLDSLDLDFECALFL